MTASDLPAYRRWAETPITEPIEYSVVIPAYNEAERILPTVGAVAVHMSSLDMPWELIVADDGSTDNTIELLDGLDLVNMHVLRAHANGGKGSAVRRGVLAAQGQVILFADADQSTPIEQFSALLSEIKAGHDVAIGSRAAEGATVSNKSIARKVFSKGLNLLVRFGFGVPFADTQCGFKMFTRPAAELLFRRQLVDEFSFDLEVLYLAKKFDLSVAEVPVEWIDAPGSTVDATKVAIEFVRDMAQIKWSDIRGRYNDVNHPETDDAGRNATRSRVSVNPTTKAET